MRLIDADAFERELRRHIIKNDCCYFTSGQKAINDSILDCIDLLGKVPTIKTFTLADIEAQYRKGLEKGLEERPHGEWIFTGRYNVYGGTEIECSNCHTKLMVSMSRWEFGENFCDVCGSQNK